MNDETREAIDEAALPVCDAISRAMYGGCEMEYLTPENQRLVQRAAEAASEALAPFIDRLVEQARAEALRWAANKVDAGPTSPLPPSVISALLREYADAASTGEGDPEKERVRTAVAQLRRDVAASDARFTASTGEGDRG